MLVLNCIFFFFLLVIYLFQCFLMQWREIHTEKYTKQPSILKNKKLVLAEHGLAGVCFFFPFCCRPFLRYELT